MSERVQLSQRMLSEAEIRLRESRKILDSASQLKLGELRRSSRILATSQRNMEWILKAPVWFRLPSEHIKLADDLKSSISNIRNDFYVKISDRQKQRSMPKMKANMNFDMSSTAGDDVGLTSFEINRFDVFVRFLEAMPPVDYSDLWERAKEQRRSQIDSMLSDGLSFGEATNVSPILNQSEDKFRADLKAIDNDIVEQIKIVEHCLPRWFSMGEFPPPYSAWRIAVILRKAKEYRRENRFLHAYLLNFRSRYGGSRRDAMLIERAEEMGIVLPPVR